MDGWCSVEELTRWGFAQSPVLMANEAHSGLRRCIRTRQVGERMVRAAHETGVRRLAMEALPWRPGDAPGPFREIPPERHGYRRHRGTRRAAVIPGTPAAPAARRHRGGLK